MAFYDNPIVDRYSEACEESVNAVRNLLTQKRGFICKDENPDKGTDLNVELIDLDKQTNIGDKFPVQIKSIQKLKIVKNKKYISYSLKTSRIGLFSRIQPTYGIFIFYSVENNNLYFDFTEKIIDRLDKQQNEDWRERDKVNVNIPIQNILDGESVKIIYDILRRRFDNARLLIHEEGQNYQIPSFINGKNDSYSIDAILDKIENLGLGYMLFNEKRFDILDNLISQLSRIQVQNSPTLILLAFITYCELGRGIDAKYYLAKAKSLKSNYDDLEKELLEIHELKLKFIFAQITAEEYIDGLNKVKLLVEKESNRVSLQSNIIQLKLMSRLKKDKSLESLEQELMQQFNEIDSLIDIKESDKYFLKIYFSDSLHYFTSKLFMDVASVVKTQRILKLNPNYKRENDNKILLLIELNRKILDKALVFAIETDNKLMEAEALYRKGFFFIQFQINLMLTLNLTKESIITPIYIDLYNCLGKAAMIFRDEDRVLECKRALNILYELKILYEFFKDEPIGKEDNDYVLNIIRKLENENDLPIFESVVKKIIDDFYKKDLSNQTLDFSDEHALDIVKHLMIAWELPENCFNNLLNSVKDRFFFDKNNKDGRYILLERQSNNKIDMYSTPVYYMIQDKNTGIMSAGHPNVKFLMTQFRII